jgi:hypothetical protein
MRPAFTRLSHAAYFAALLTFLLAGPALVAPTGIQDRADVWTTVPTYAGPTPHIQHELFEADEPLDVVFIGSSFMWSGIDAPHVQREISLALGREASVTVLASVWAGLDRDYAILRDLLDRRSVRMVVLQLPNRDLPTDDEAAEYNRVADGPHVQAFRFFRRGEMEDAFEGLPVRYAASLYGGAVLGLPRHLLTLLRPNRVAEIEYRATLGARLDPAGYFGAPYERFRPTPPVIPVEEMILGPGTASTWRFFDEPIPPYQLHFAREIAELLGERGVPTVLLHLPQANELTADHLEERMDWVEVIGIDATLVGIPPARLFGGYTREEALHFFSSDHLNDNGAIYFTTAVAPALVRVFEDHAATR